MEKKVILSKSEKVTLDGVEIEIKGEVFDKPIAKSDNYTCFTRIMFVDVKSGGLWGVKLQMIPNPLNEKELQHELDWRVKNIQNFKADEPSQQS